MKLFHSNPTIHHQRLASLLQSVWNEKVVFSSDSDATKWLDSGWLDTPNLEEPNQRDRGAWIYWRTWMWEQSLPKDLHGRPVGKPQSQPLSQPEAELLARQWGAELGCTILPASRPAPIIVVDIDHLLAFSGRGWASVVRGWVTDLVFARFKNIRMRIQGPDPFDSYSYWSALAVQFPNLELQFFALLSERRGLYDRGVRFSSSRVRELLQNLALRFDVGTHLSYASHSRTSGYRTELGFLEEILGRAVVRQRSHFLKNAGSPDFLAELESLGVTEDWSLQFADVAGFRSGWATAVPFGGLVQFPVAAMDQNFLGMEPRAIADQLHHLQAAAWSVGAPLRVGTHWRIFGPHPEVEGANKDFSAWRSGMELWLNESQSA